MEKVDFLWIVMIKLIMSEAFFNQHHVLDIGTQRHVHVKYGGKGKIFNEYKRGWVNMGMCHNRDRSVFYAVGGMSGHGSFKDCYYSDIHQYSAKTGDWVTLNVKLPIPLANMAVELIGIHKLRDTFLMICGGYTIDGETSGSMFVLDLRTEKWIN